MIKRATFKNSMTMTIVDRPRQLRAHSFIARLVSAHDDGKAIRIDARERRNMAGYYEIFKQKGFTFHASGQPDGAVICWLDRIEDP